MKRAHATYWWLGAAACVPVVYWCAYLATWNAWGASHPLSPPAAQQRHAWAALFFMTLTLVAGLAAMTFFCIGVAAILRKGGRDPGRCACGYNLTGNVTGRCPECGEPVPAGRGT